MGQLYEQDLYLWAETTAHLLREKRFSEIELDALIEELDDMGRSQKRGLDSQLERVIMHLLKWQFQPEMRSTSWRLSIFEGRKSIKKAIEYSPSLKRLVPDLVLSCYPDAKESAIIETGLPEWVFPEQNPFTVDQILDSRFLPE